MVRWWKCSFLMTTVEVCIVMWLCKYFLIIVLPHLIEIFKNLNRSKGQITRCVALMLFAGATILLPCHIVKWNICGLFQDCCDRRIDLIFHVWIITDDSSYLHLSTWLLVYIKTYEYKCVCTCVCKFMPQLCRYMRERIHVYSWNCTSLYV